MHRKTFQNKPKLTLFFQIVIKNAVDFKTFEATLRNFGKKFFQLSEEILHIASGVYFILGWKPIVVWLQNNLCWKRSYACFLYVAMSVVELQVCFSIFFTCANCFQSFNM